MRPEYARKLAGDLGMELAEVQPRSPDPRQWPQQTNEPRARSAGRPRARRSSRHRAPDDPADPRLAVEREVLKLAIQQPAMAGPVFDEIAPTPTPTPSTPRSGRPSRGRGVAAASRAAPPGWMRLRSRALHDGHPVGASPSWRSSRSAPAVTRTRREVRRRQPGRPARGCGSSPAIAEIKSKLQRINPLEEPDQHAGSSATWWPWSSTTARGLRRAGDWAAHEPVPPARTSARAGARRGSSRTSGRWPGRRTRPARCVASPLGLWLPGHADPARLAPTSPRPAGRDGVLRLVRGVEVEDGYVESQRPERVHPGARRPAAGGPGAGHAQRLGHRALPAAGRRRAAGVRIVGRKVPGQDGLRWRAHLDGGASRDDPQVRDRSAS